MIGCRAIVSFRKKQRNFLPRSKPFAMFTNSWTTIFATIVCRLNSWGRASGLFITWSSPTGVDRRPLPAVDDGSPESRDIFGDFWKLAYGAMEYQTRTASSVAVPSEEALGV